tara:strand:- start:8481 stop:8753 length:273 start_codon:yes stop_codon:yes gene_type:complete
MKPYEQLRRKQALEIKELFEMFSHLTITEASRAMGIDDKSLRTYAFRFGVAFAKMHGGHTAVETDQQKINKQLISLPKVPWDIGEETKRH